MNNDDNQKKDEFYMDDELGSDFLQSIDNNTIPPTNVSDRGATNNTEMPEARSSNDTVTPTPTNDDLLADDLDKFLPDESLQPEEMKVAESKEKEDNSDIKDTGDNKDWLEDGSKDDDLPGQLALDIYETKNHLIVLCRVAGVDEENIDVSISADNILNIRGTLIPTIKETIENHFIQECYWGEFSRSISLPVDVKKDEISATLESGILKILFIKIKQDAIQKININKS